MRIVTIVYTRVRITEFAKCVAAGTAKILQT